MLLWLYYKKANGEEVMFDGVLGFTIKKEAFTPYTTLNAVVIGTVTALPSDIHEVRLLVENYAVHQGIVDSYKVIEENGFRKAIISSRGYTSLLTDNQIAPGLYTDITLNRLFTDYFTLPNISHEDNDTLSYIYVNKGSAMWDGVSNLSYKLTGNYPYIRKTNTVMISMPTDVRKRIYSEGQIISRGTEVFNRRMVSHYHMADISGKYGTFDSVSDEAVSRNIIRHHYFDLDRRFLYSPQSACDFRTMMSTRGFKRKFFTYNGYYGEDINDIVTFDDVEEKRVKAVKITGNAKGIFTEVSVYEDF